MKIKIAHVPSIKAPIARSPGFEKKQLSDSKLDICALCGFGCRYCSSNHGNYLRIRGREFAALAEQQLGETGSPTTDPSMMFVWPDVLDRLVQQLDVHDAAWGQGKTLVFSMLTDGFSPVFLSEQLPDPGVVDTKHIEALPPEQTLTGRALNLLLERTSFRVRILTKNAIIGSTPWINFFARHRDRFVLGLSIGTLDDRWTRQIELGTSSPTSRLVAMSNLQEAGMATYGMLCPVFPDVLDDDSLEFMVDWINPAKVEHIWAEPYNDRMNWRAVRGGYAPASVGYRWLTDVFEHKCKDLWSRYTTDLYDRLRTHAERNGWLHKLRFLLYEDQITQSDAQCFRGLHGVLLQSKPGPDGRSRNPHIAALRDVGDQQ